jgi:hypothetical protein
MSKSHSHTTTTTTIIIINPISSDFPTQSYMKSFQPITSISTTHVNCVIVCATYVMPEIIYAKYYSKREANNYTLHAHIGWKQMALLKLKSAD